MKKRISIYAQLAKLRITIMVSVTTILGYILFTGTIDSHVILPTLGLFLLACGSSVLNHIQERKTDAMMERTKNRPLPSGAISLAEAAIFAGILIIPGLLILFFSINITGGALGLLALIWYNGVYTPLKHRSPIAVIPGSLIGAIPPVIGWVAGGGNYLDPQILVFAAYFFIWQIPHFWLLLLIHDKDYNKAGIPTLTQILSQRQLEQVTFMWIVATAFFAISIPFISNYRFAGMHIILLLGSILLIYKSIDILRIKMGRKSYGKTFMSINIFTLFFIFITAMDKLISL